MSGDEQFLSRWSRRKRAAEQTRETPKADPAPAELPASSATIEATAAPPPRSKAPVTAPPVDPATLPSIESITAATDIRPFLAPGVPAELTRAALRRVWTSDPSIRDFVGLADYAWDFNAPDSIAGFGSIEMSAQLRNEIVRMVGRSLPGGDLPETEAREELASAKMSDQPSSEQRLEAGSHPDRSPVTGSNPSQPVLVQRNQNDVASQDKQESQRMARPGRRQHGGAMPE